MGIGYLNHVDLTTSRQDVLDVGVTTGSSAPGIFSIDIYNAGTAERTVTVEIDQDDSGVYTEIAKPVVFPGENLNVIKFLDADDTIACKQDSGTDIDVDVYQIA